MEEENKIGLDRKQMTALQLMAIAAILLTFFTGDKVLFAFSMLTMCVLKAIAMVTFEDKREAAFAALYTGLTIMLFFDL
tara:strand:- start:1066 stop:1302 length:237 start_codon:yes stop_codon:yes gene_type:complete